MEFLTIEEIKAVEKKALGIFKIKYKNSPKNFKYILNIFTELKPYFFKKYRTVKNFNYINNQFFNCFIYNEVIDLNFYNRLNFYKYAPKKNYKFISDIIGDQLLEFEKYKSNLFILWDDCKNLAVNIIKR